MKVINNLAIFASLIASVKACSNIIISPGASADSSSIIAYNADSVTLYGSLYHYPSATHQLDEVILNYMKSAA